MIPHRRDWTPATVRLPDFLPDAGRLRLGQTARAGTAGKTRASSGVRHGCGGISQAFFRFGRKIFPHRLRKAAVPAGSSGSGMGIFFSGRGCLVLLFVSPLGFYVSPRGGSLSDQRDP